MKPEANHSIDVPELALAAPASLADVRVAFRHVPRLEMKQAWRASAEPEFAPARVHVGWRGPSLCVFAELADRDIVTRTTAQNQRFWELGDTFEIFLRPAGQTAYVEFHVAPNNLHLQLRFSNDAWLTARPRVDPFATALVPGELFQSQVWIQPGHVGWCVFAEIPAEAVCERPPARLGGATWLASFSRYDYTSDRPAPVISSTSPHALPSFHRQQEWCALRFV